MTSAPVHLDVIAQFDDGTSSTATITIDLADSNTGPTGGPISVNVPGSRSDADPADLAAALSSRVDAHLGDAVPESDLDGAIADTVASLLGQPTTSSTGAPTPAMPGQATPAQRAKFDRFMAHPLHDEVLDVFRGYLALVGATLDRDDLGTHWGVTVGLGESTLLRVNVSFGEVLVVRADRTTRLYLQGAPPPSAPTFAREVLDGLRTAKPNHALLIGFDDIPTAFADPTVATAAAARIEATWRPLPQANYHNPLTNPLIVP